MINTLVNRVVQLAKVHPSKLAVVFNKESLSYAELSKHIEMVGKYLIYLGIKKGDRVLLAALSKPEMVAAYLGIQYCGAIVVFIDKNCTLENARVIYDETKAAIFLTDRPMNNYEGKMNVHSLKQIFSIKEIDKQISYVEPIEGDIAEILFTTGTTGKPKGVVHTYKSIYNILLNTIEGIGITTEERILIPLPLSHSFALRVLRAAIFQGSTVILQNGFAFAKDLENNQKEYQCTAMIAVPASMEMLYEQMGEKFSEVIGKFRYIEIGAGSLSFEQRKRFLTLLPNTIIYNTWGSTETGGALFFNISDTLNKSELLGSIGKPLPHIQLKVLNNNGDEIESSAGNPGRMALKGDMVMLEYWNEPELTLQTIHEGWIWTNDIVYIDENGYVYMIGRADDIINVGGEKVSTIGIENIARGYEFIKECACIGVEDPQGILGQIPVLFVVIKNVNYRENDLRSYLSMHLERYKIPKEYILIPELPRNQMGKIDRTKLLDIWKNKKESQLMNPVVQAILTRRSIRRFQNKPIPKEILDMILKAGYHAPTGHNKQSWQFTVLRSSDKIEELRQTIKKVAYKRVRMYGFHNPSCIILISNDINNPDGCQDSACAAENIFLAAHSYGIGSVWINVLMTLCDEEPLRKLLSKYKIPQNHRVWCMAALGYPENQEKEEIERKEAIYYVD